MSFRTDVSIDWEADPRIITVASPSVEITMQDLADTLRGMEHLPSVGFDVFAHEYIVDLSGKEPLGGGVSVGITLSLKNAKLAFEARPGPTFVQCNVSGGNIVAFDSGGSEMDPIQTTAFVQVVRTSSSSATLQNIEAIEFSSFQGGIWIDKSSSNTGTSYPVGNREYPVNNIADAKAIAVARGFKRLYFLEDSWTLGATDDVTGYLIEGLYHDRSVCTLETGVTIEDAQFNHLALQGDAGSDFCVLQDCSIRNLDNFDGNIYHSELGGRIKINLGSYRHWIRCTTNQNVGIPILDYQGIDQDLVMTGYTGDLQIENMTAGTLEFYAESSNIVIKSSCTGGTITLVGTGGLDCTGVEGTTVNTENFIDAGGLSAAQHAMLERAERKFWMGRLR